MCVNAVRSAGAFNGRIAFTETLIPYDWDTTWIEQSLNQMFAVLNSTELHGSNPACENCAYSFQRARVEVPVSICLSVIAQHKHDGLNHAISWMLGGGLVGIVFAMILVVSAGLL